MSLTPKKLECQRRYRERHRDALLQQQRTWRLEHPGYEAAATKKWGLSHPDKLKLTRERGAEVQRRRREADIEYPQARAESWARWNAAHPGAKAVHKKRGNAKRRMLGFVPMNQPFVGCEGHHVNQNDVIYIPKELHQSIRHNQQTGQGMEQINALAVAWFTSESIQ